MQRQHMIDFIHTFKTEKKSSAQDRKVGQAMSKQKVLDKMELLENPDIESTDKFSLRFPEPGQLRIPLIAEIKGLNFRYPKRALNVEEDKKAEEERRLKRQQGTLATGTVVTTTPAIDPTIPYLLQDINVRVEISSRVGIIGANGCGQA
jgi:ATPase subunit of ABC transporter with duplicated ATPase domains